MISAPACWSISILLRQAEYVCIQTDNRNAVSTENEIVEDEMKQGKRKEEIIRGEGITNERNSRISAQ